MLRVFGPFYCQVICELLKVGKHWIRHSPVEFRWRKSCDCRDQWWHERNSWTFSLQNRTLPKVLKLRIFGFPFFEISWDEICWDLNKNSEILFKYGISNYSNARSSHLIIIKTTQYKLLLEFWVVSFFNSMSKLEVDFFGHNTQIER